MNIHRLFSLVSPTFRRRRMQTFLDAVQPTAAQPILDVGGTPWNWELIDWRGPVVLFNQALPTTHPGALPDGWRYDLGDGRDLPYEDGAFPVAFSNSVIEHVGDGVDQRAFAQELSRVGRALWIQTPAREFFLEPHLLTPWFHRLPRTWQRTLARNATLWGLLTRPSRAQAEALVDELQLLGYEDMRRMFPDCEIVRERFLGMTKSYIAYRRAA